MLIKGIKNKLFREGYVFKRMLSFLEESKFYSRQEIINYQDEKLRELIHHAYNNVPYYKEVFDKIKLKPNDIKSQNDLWKIPLLTKKDVKENFKKLKATNVPRFMLHLGHTSGTTGTPAHFYRDFRSINFENAIVWRQWNEAGVFSRDRKAVCRGDIIVPQSQSSPPFWNKDPIEKKLYLSAFHLSSSNLQYYIDEILSYKPVSLQAYPSTAYTIAQYLKKTDQKINLKAVFTSSEPLYSFQRELIEERMNCKVWDFYGMAERVISASECKYHTGLHINEEYGITEFINGKSDREGIMVGTSLHNFAMPLIRYVTNDYGKLSEQSCPCGSEHRLLEPIETKQEDMIITKDGKWISPSIITHAFKPLTHVAKSQVIQHEINRYEILIVPEKGFNKKEEDILLSGLKERFGQDADIKIRIVNDISRTKNGKFRWVISHVKKEL